MPVFLSHKREDTNATLLIAHYLRSKGLKCYVDVFDPAIKSTDDLTELLMSRVRSCTHVMAVVSEYTTQSWWVPFEIGVGSELDRRITTYKLSSVQLPDFLTKWPVLSSYEHLDKFILWYKRDSTIDFTEGRAASAPLERAVQFHSLLKASLGQL